MRLLPEVELVLISVVGPVSKPVTLRPGATQSDQIRTPVSPEDSYAQPSDPDSRSQPCARVPFGELNGGPRLPAKCSSVTRGQLIKAQGRGRGARPLSPRGQGSVSARQQVAAITRVAGCSIPGEAMCWDFSDLVNQTQVFSCSHFPRNTCSSVRPPLLHAPGMPTSHV